MNERVSASVNDCPVCGKAGLAADAAQCPQCGADLECFQLLDALHEGSGGRGASEVPHAQPRKRNKTIWWLVIILFAIWLYPDEDAPNDRSKAAAAAESTQIANEVTAVVKRLDRRMHRFENRLTDVSTGQKSVHRNLEATKRQLAAMSNQLRTLQGNLSAGMEHPAPNKPQDFRYCQPRDRQSLPAIAERCYGDKTYYPLLLEYNPGLGIHYAPAFGPLKVIKDRNTARARLQELIIATPKQRLMRYRVIRGDSWPVLSRRLFGDADHSAQLQALNWNLPLTEGERILIPLP